MQIRSVLFIVGVLLVCVGASLVLPLGVSLWYGDGAFLGLLSSLVIMVGGGLALAYTNRSQTPLNLTLRDGFAVVGICWIVASFAGGLPFVLTSTASVTDAVFEAASGFTTTGATIFADIEGLPHGLLMWRSLTHWIGGLGIILLSLIVLPLLGVVPDDTAVTLAAAEGKPLVQYTYHGAALACHHIAGRLCGRRVPLMKITNR